MKWTVSQRHTADYAWDSKSWSIGRYESHPASLGKCNYKSSWSRWSRMLWTFICCSIQLDDSHRAKTCPKNIKFYWDNCFTNLGRKSDAAEVKVLHLEALNLPKTDKTYDN